jgi:hypothetical protein
MTRARRPLGPSEAEQLRAALEQLTGGEDVEVWEDGHRLPGLPAPRFELRGDGRWVLHIWSQDRSLVRPVAALLELSADRIRLAVERLGRSRLSRLEIIRQERTPRRARQDREQFLGRLQWMLRQQFPDEQLQGLTMAADLEHSLPDSYARGWTVRGRQAWAVVAVPWGAGTQTAEGSLTVALVWHRQLRMRLEVPVLGVRLVVPPGCEATVAHRAAALRPDVEFELYCWSPDEATAREVDLRDRGNRLSRLMAASESAGLLAQVRSLDTLLRSLAPEAITVAALPASGEVVWRFRGLEFACWRSGQLWFGLGPQRQLLTEGNWSSLAALVHELATHRVPRPPDRHHPFYRAARERWLESVVMADPARIDPRLDPQRLYSQVLLLAGGERGRVDLLGVRRDGRLAVLELKADESFHLVLQAVDYWLHVRRHQLEGDLERLGYLPGGAPLAPPVLYLVAPALRFHPQTETLLQYLLPEIPVCQVGINESWREGLDVVWRRWRGGHEAG